MPIHSTTAEFWPASSRDSLVNLTQQIQVSFKSRLSVCETSQEWELQVGCLPRLFHACIIVCSTGESIVHQLNLNNPQDFNTIKPHLSQKYHLFPSKSRNHAIIGTARTSIYTECADWLSNTSCRSHVQWLSWTVPHVIKHALPCGEQDELNAPAVV